MEWATELGGAQAAAIALAVLFGALLIVTYSWNWLPRRQASRVPLGDAGETHDAVARLYSELPQFLQDVNSRLDAKIHVLRRLLHEASLTIDELRRIQNTPTAPHTSNEPAAERISDSAAAVRLTADVPAAPPAECQAVEIPGPDTTELRSQRYAHVYSLEDSGLDPAEISGETGMHRGEVELVLNLRHKRVRADRGVRLKPAPAVRSPEEAPA